MNHSIDSISPPAIVSSVASIDTLIFEISSAVEAGERLAEQGAARFREAGVALLNAKKLIPRGEWEEWVRTNIKRDPGTARRWMTLANRAPAHDCASINEQWSIICGNNDTKLDSEEEVASESEDEECFDDDLEIPNRAPAHDSEPQKPAKSNDSQKPKETIFCMKCKKAKEPLKNCVACHNLRIGRPANTPATREPGDDTEEIPKSVKNALADTWHAECAQTISQIRRQCNSAFTWSSWLDPSVTGFLRAAEQCFLAAMPTILCPDCNGQKLIEGQPCLTCRQGGFMGSQMVEKSEEDKP